MASPSYPLGPLYNYDLPYKLGLKLYPSVYGDPTDQLSPSAGSFVESESTDGEKSYRFEPSPAARKFLEDFRESSGGLSLNVQPLEKSPYPTPPGIGGVYFSGDPKYGHINPKERAVYLNPNNNNLFVLTHEAGHAADPLLDPKISSRARGNEATQNVISAYSDPSVTPKAFLSSYLRGPLETARAEVQAQKSAAESMERAGVSPREQVLDLYFKGYPATKVEQGLDTAALENVKRSIGFPVEGDLTPFSKEGPAGSRVAFSVFNPSDIYARGLMNLGLDPEYRASEEAVRERARQMIDPELNPIVNRYR